jgi:hypothetical protein
VVVRSADRDTATSAATVHVVNPCVTDVRLEAPVAFARCADGGPGVDGGTEGLPGDVLVVTGGAWDPAQAVVRLGPHLVPPSPPRDGGPDPAVTLRVPLPPGLPWTQVSVESPGQASTPSHAWVRTVEPRVDSVTLEPVRRQLACRDAPVGTLPGFPLDVIVVTGCGWDPGAVGVVLGNASFPALPAPPGDQDGTRHVRVALPAQLPPVPVQVNSRGQLSGPSAQQVCVAGPGHLPPLVLQRGDMDPQVTIMAAGTAHPAGRRCSPGGWGQGAEVEDCGTLHWPQDTLAVAYTLGAYPDRSSRTFLAAVTRDSELLASGVLDAPDAGLQRTLMDIRPFRLDQDGGVGVAVAETLTDLSHRGTARQVAMDGQGRVRVLREGPSTVLRVLNAPLDQHGAAVFSGLENATGPSGHLHQSYRLDGGVGPAVPLPGGWTTAAGMMEPGWDDSAHHDGLLLDLACSPAAGGNEVYVNRVTPDGGHWSNGYVAAGTPREHCDADDDCQALKMAWAGGLGGSWPQAVAECASSVTCASMVLPCVVPQADCMRPLQLLAKLCLDDPACGPVLRAGGPASACPTFPPQPGGGCPDPQFGWEATMACLRSMGCTLGVECQVNPALSSECASVADLLRFHDCVESGGVCERHLFAVQACLANPACRGVAQAGGPASNCPSVAGSCIRPAGGLEHACTERQGCLAAVACAADPTSHWRCPFINQLVGIDAVVDPGADLGCLSAPCKAARCATSLTCRSTAGCQQDRAACASHALCVQRLCSSEPVELAPYAGPDDAGRGALAVAVPNGRTAQGVASRDLVCLVDTQSGALSGRSLGFQPLDVAILPQARGSHGTVMALPTADPPLREVRVFADDVVTTVTTPRAYRFLRADPVRPQVYAVPQTGHRVDVLAADGRLLGHTSVLGGILNVFPAPVDHALLAYARTLVMVDLSGKVVAMLSHDGVTTPHVAPTGLPSHAWTTASPVGGGNYQLAGVPLVLQGQPRFAEDAPVTLDLQGAPAGPFPVVAVWSMGDTVILARLREGWNRAELGAVSIPDMSAVPAPSAAVVRWAPGESLGFPVATSAAAQRLALVRTGASYSFTLLDFLAEPPTLVPRREADGVLMTQPRCPDAGSVPGCATECDAWLPGDRCQAGFPISVIVAMLPSGSTLGFFHHLHPYRYEMGGITPGGYYATLESPPPFAATAAVASPDGRHVYVGMANSIVDLAVEEHDGPPWFSYRVERTIAVRGTPSRLFVDPLGTRILFQCEDEGVLAPVE